jgi:RNA polymerase sigma-70 factor (ECF subfamily)
MDEEALIQAAKDGDLDAFNRLVLTYQDMVYYQAYRMLDEQAPAEDVAQITFISAYRHLNSFRGGSFRAWLLRIATNASYDELRRRKRRPTTPLEPMDDEGEENDSAIWMVDPDEGPEERSQRSELRRAIQHCLNELLPDFRTVVLLVDVQGLDYAEAAQAMGTPVGTVKSRLSRARGRMQDCLQGFWELLPANFRFADE